MELKTKNYEENFQLELAKKQEANKQMEEYYRRKITDKTRAGKDSVYTLGISISYNEMIRLMDTIIKNNASDEPPVFLVTSSNEKVCASGFVFLGVDDEKMFFGTFGEDENPTSRPYCLEDVNAVSEEEQKWCVGKVMFAEREYAKHRTESISSLLRSLMVAFN